MRSAAVLHGDNTRGWNMRSLSTEPVEDPRSAPFHLRQPGTHPGGTPTVERLRMVPPEYASEGAFRHTSVMVTEVTEILRAAPEGVFIDGTLGAGGHTAAALDANDALVALGIDRDADARAAASRNLERFGERAVVRSGTFDQLDELAKEAFPGRPVTAVLFDLGVSSHQIDSAARGFSYRHNGPLDMRMDRASGVDAATIVNQYDEAALARLLLEGGEERFSRRVAAAIVAARPVADTNELAEIVRNSIPAPARRRPGDPAKRTFQALRLAVNDELGQLRNGLDKALALLAPGGRCVTLAYHSGEDRMIKQTFADVVSGGCRCPSALPCVCGAEAGGRLLVRGALKASEVEQQSNSRSESARLRAIEIFARNESGETR